MNTLKEKLLNIFIERFQINERYLIESYFDSPLTGEPFNIGSIDLVYLFFEIEKQYNIRFEEVDILNYGFFTINKILYNIKKYYDNCILKKE